MTTRHSDIRALRVMIEEIRGEAPPELPWAILEDRLFTQIDNHPRWLASPAAPRQASVLGRGLAYASAAALIVLGLGTVAGSGEFPIAARARDHCVDVSSLPLSPSVRNERDLKVLSAGDVLEANTTSLRFEQPGVVTWSIAPGSVARVVSIGRAGIGQTIELIAGTLHAEVTPRHPSEGLVEAFAVEAVGTRIAVHGTAFSVTREADRVVVDVEHGAVAIGPVGHVGTTTGHLLVGPARAAFSLDGGRVARILPAVAKPIPVAHPPPASALPQKEDRPAAARSDSNVDVRPLARRSPIVPAGAHQPEATAPLPPEPGAAPPAPKTEPALLTAANIRAHLARCFRQSYEANGSTVDVSVTSTLRVDVAADGTVRAARFDPPLKPEFQACAGSAIAGRFAAGAGHLDIAVSFKP